MKKLIKGLIILVVALALLMNTALGQAVTQTIQVVYNSVNLTVNGQKIEADNILCNGTTYVPLRAVAEALGKEVVWDGNTNTASINDKAETAKVIRVVDGDTLVVNFQGQEEKIRLIGVDTSESVHPDVSKNVEEGKIASNFTKDKLEGKDVTLEFDVQERDQYGRLLAYVYLDGVMFNKTLLAEGYAQVSTYPPNVKYVEEFTELQRVARENNKGLWNEETFNNEVVSEVKTSGNYVGSLNSDKYHKPSCQHAKNIESYNEIWFDTAEEAQNAGYTACGVCRP